MEDMRGGRGEDGKRIAFEVHARKLARRYRENTTFSVIPFTSRTYRSRREQGSIEGSRASKSTFQRILSLIRIIEKDKFVSL